MRKIILNTTILTQNKKREIIFCGFVVVKNDKIVTVGSGKFNKRLYGNDEIIDGKNLIITPGLINAHVHFGETIYKKCIPNKISLENYLSLTEKIANKYKFIESERDSISDYTALKILETGTSTVAGGRVYESSNKLGLRCVSGYMVMKSKKLKKFSLSIISKFKEEFKKNSKLCSVAVFVHSLNYVSYANLISVKKVLDYFPKTVFMIHISETEKQERETNLKFKKKSIVVLKDLGLINKNSLLIHGNCLKEEDFDCIAKANASLVHCLSSNINVADRVLNINQALKHGVNICLATDGYATSKTFNILSELKRVYKYSLKNEYGLISPQNIFDMITVNAAKALKFSDIGSIEIGKKADLAVWQKPCNKNIKEEKILTDLFFSEKRPKLEFLIIDGKNIISRGKFLKDKKNIIDKFKKLEIKISNQKNENNIS